MVVLYSVVVGSTTVLGIRNLLFLLLWRNGNLEEVRKMYLRRDLISLLLSLWHGGGGARALRYRGGGLHRNK